MVLGGMLYDPGPLNRLLPEGLDLSVETARRLPVAVVLCQALVCLVISLRMVEPPRGAHHPAGNTLKSAFKLTFETARWVLTHPKTRLVVVSGLLIDSIVRNFATITSSYYRLIELPEWTYGIIGAALGLLGWFVPGIATRLNNRFSTLGNLGIAAGLAVIGLAALIPAWPVFGILPAMLLMTLMGYLGFTVSRALHAEADSARRATVLSVKGLAFNLGYGLFSLAFSGLLARFPAEPPGLALRSALFWQLPAFALVIIPYLAWNFRKRRRSVAEK
jgi:hypothetical protein